jgi:MerR family transcriptional regulator, copper efflux regulator
VREPIPIACSLSEDERTDRALEFQGLAKIGLLSRERIEGGVRLRFRASDALHARLAEAIHNEKECCPFFDFDLERREDVLLLRVSAPTEAEPLLDALFARSPVGDEAS